MSLSQKHAGLILVPWFNSHEWHYVYHLAYSHERNKQLKALELLKIWKLRTPILSTGVEGTLILLDALLLNTDHLASEHVANLYSIALMRFLNLSAANSDKQGSFAKTSAKNELPKWLINLRHDVAHGHHIPSLSNLRMGLNFGINWLKEKYWEPQSKIIKDYYIGDGSNIIDPHLINYLKMYVKLNMSIFENQKLEAEYIEMVKDLIHKKLKKVVMKPGLMLECLLEMITRSLEIDYQKNQLRSDVYMEVIVTPEALLKLNFKEDEEGSERLDYNFRNIWESLLNTLHQCGYLFVLIHKLFDATGNISFSDNSRKMAAMWVNELLVSLDCLKNLEEQGGDELKLEPNHYNYALEASNFEEHVFQMISSDDYFIYFLDSLLKYNLNEPFNEDVLNLVKAKSDSENSTFQGIGEIHTLEDLNIQDLFLEEAQMESFNGIESVTPVPSSNNSPKSNAARVVAGPKWKKIEDTSMFMNCPLGVLPHQVQMKHPFLLVN